ncbi:MAG: proline--tRNA ligase [Actinomycetota bacterium]
MRLSQLFSRTLREAPADADAPSHRLLLRAGMIRQLMAGVYSFLPLGLRTLQRVEHIVREEMDAAGAQQVRLPAIVPSEPWKVTGRWDAYVEEDLLFTLHDRQDRELALGPTHEEIITPLVASEVESYRDLPVNAYQIQWKYRDEARPRSGLLRGREFLMKDAYSFDRDVDGLRESYRKMVDAYRAILTRCGLDFAQVEADPGLIGGDVNHEFMAPADVGEDLFVRCERGDYAANVEAAVAATPDEATGAPAERQDVPTPGASTIEAVATLLEVAPGETLKSMAYVVDGAPILVLVPGDRDVNEGKLRRLFSGSELRMFDTADFGRYGMVVGFTGPQDHDGVTIVADNRVRTRSDWITGANRADAHTKGIAPGRDFTIDRLEDIATVTDGDVCPRCGGGLTIGRSVEVGHTFQLGTRYSEPLKSTFVDDDGIERPLVMGCYGMGISRVIGAVVEQHNDDDGIVWPKALAPFQVVIVMANRDHAEVVARAESLYRVLTERGLDTALDDRDASAGVKFTDADLIGYPVQVVVGKRGIDGGTVDVKVRASGERSQAPVDNAVEAIVQALHAAP